jgi:hypothetical protein
MGKVTLGGAVPPDNNNGLAPFAEDFIDSYKPGQPLTLVTVVARVSVTKIITKTETGEVYPVLRWQHIEVVPSEHMEAAGRILGDAFGERTGMLELPFPDGKVPLKLDPFPEEAGEVEADDEPIALEAHRGRGRS